LYSTTLQELNVLAKDVIVRLTGSLHKADIVNCLIGVAQIGMTQDNSLDEKTNYVIYNQWSKNALHTLSTFSSVKEWNKKLKGVSKDFMSMHLSCLWQGQICNHWKLLSSWKHTSSTMMAL